MSGYSDANSKAIADTETAGQHEHWRHAADRSEADSGTRATNSDTGNL
jgi:hypothetical protein